MNLTSICRCSVITKSILLILPGCFLSGLIVYTVLSILLVPLRITLPISITMSVLIFGLSKYYSATPAAIEEKIHASKRASLNSIRDMIFIGIFVVALLILIVSPANDGSKLFTNWQEIDALEIIRIAAATGLCFLLPGYAIVTILDRTRGLTILLKVLLAYSFSILITGIVGYIGASTDMDLTDRRTLLVSCSVVLLVLFLIFRLRSNIVIRKWPDHFYQLLLASGYIIRKRKS